MRERPTDRPTTDASEIENMRSTIQATGRAPALVTSFEEHRASLAERKNYRRSSKIDDKDASVALVGVSIVCCVREPSGDGTYVLGERRADAVARGCVVCACVS